MFSEVRRLFASEMTKVWRTKLPYIGLACSALMALVARQSVEGFAQPGEVTAFGYFIASIILSSTLTTPIFATIFSAMTIASETSRGTLRTVLVRPVTRTQFLTSKLLSAILYLILLVAANGIVALFVARGYPLRSVLDRGAEQPAFGDQVLTCTAGLALSLIPQTATVCFAFLVSVLVGTGGTAVGVALGLYLTITAAKQFISIGGYELSQFIFSTYYDLPMKIADSKIGGMYEVWWQDRMAYMLGTSLTAMVIFLVVSYIVFLRRDLNI